MRSGDSYRRLQRAFPTHVEAKQIADVCARIEGTALVAATLLSLIGAFSGVSLATTLSLAALAVGGASVLGYLALRRGTAAVGSTWHIVTGIAQLRLLAGLGALLALGGTVGMLLPSSSAGTIRTLVASVAGVGFVLHRQHGTGGDVRRARRVQRAVSVTLLLAAALGVFASGVPAAIALLAGGILLIAHDEPLGAMRRPGLTTHYMDVGEIP